MHVVKSEREYIRQENKCSLRSHFASVVKKEKVVHLTNISTPLELIYITQVGINTPSVIWSLHPHDTVIILKT